MSERTYSLRKLRDFVKQRALGRREWKPITGMTETQVDDCVFAIKIRDDECREIMREIDRMLKFKQSGRKKKS